MAGVQVSTYRGKRCPTHGITLRMRKNRQCRECFLASKRRWGTRRKRNKIRNMVYARLRKQGILQAAPPWVDWTAIKRIYNRRKPGQHVDHVVPLKGIDPTTGKHVVCGLHVPWNLRVVSSRTNDSKWAYWEACK